MNQRMGWIMACALLAACGAQNDTANAPAQQASAPAADAPPSSRPAHLSGQSTQDVRAEAPARATGLAQAMRSAPAAPAADMKSASAPAQTHATQAPASQTAAAARKPVASAKQAKAKAVAARPAAKSAAPQPAAPAAPAPKATPVVKADLSALNRCKSCHDLSPKAKARVGPGLGKGNGIAGVYGRVAGSFPGFRYTFTRYISGEPWRWDDTHLRQWICDTKKAIRAFTGDPKARTKMPSYRICDPAKQDAVIAALKSIS